MEFSITWDIIKDNPQIPWNWYWMSYNTFNYKNKKLTKEHFDCLRQLSEIIIHKRIFQKIIKYETGIKISYY